MSAALKSKFAFFGTPAVARETLARLIERGLAPALVVTSPDAAKGRGLALALSPVKELAQARGIPVLAPEALDAAALAVVKAHACAFAVVVAFGKIFPQEWLDAFPLGAVNVHYSLLPRHRGAAPLEAALLADDAQTGVTLQKMARELDAGGILAQEAVAIGPGETARELRPRLVELGARMLCETLPRFARGELAPRPQDAAAATRSRKFRKADGELDLSAPARGNWLTYRAYNDTIGTHFFAGGRRIKITQASFTNGAFMIERVVPEGHREMDYADFNRDAQKG